MSFTTASTPHRTPFRTNKMLWILAALFLLFWVRGWFHCLYFDDWLLENLLVVICIGILAATARWHRLSDLSYGLIFVFVMLHVWGAMEAYTHNSLGAWLQKRFELWRNPYDRIVHCSFGLLMAYPFREILINRWKVSPRYAWMLSVAACFGFGSLFEIIEWTVAELTPAALGESYVATQGDPWDAHKDMVLAALGAAIAMALTLVLKRKNLHTRSGSLSNAERKDV